MLKAFYFGAVLFIFIFPGNLIFHAAEQPPIKFTWEAERDLFIQTFCPSLHNFYGGGRGGKKSESLTPSTLSRLRFEIKQHVWNIKHSG